MHPSWRRPSWISASSISATQDKNLAPFAPGPKGILGDSLQRRCTHTLFCFPTPLVASSSSTVHVLLLTYRRRHHDNLTFAFKSELSCEHLWTWSERRRASKSGSCSGRSERSRRATQRDTQTHNEIMRTYSAHSRVPVHNLRRQSVEQPTAF